MAVNKRVDKLLHIYKLYICVLYTYIIVVCLYMNWNYIYIEKKSLIMLSFLKGSVKYEYYIAITCKILSIIILY